MADNDEFTGETFESKDWRDAGRRIFVSKKVEKLNRKGEVITAYVCHPTSRYGGPDYKHSTTISEAGLKKRWRKVSH